MGRFLFVKIVTFAQTLKNEPKKSLFICISDFTY
ncbi:MAG: hypothetical protein RI943_45 [Bacteroidota bacterium]|jgi:hypothetical protein